MIKDDFFVHKREPLEEVVARLLYLLFYSQAFYAIVQLFARLD